MQSRALPLDGRIPRRAALALVALLPPLLAGCGPDPREALPGTWVTATGSVQLREDGGAVLDRRGAEPRVGRWELTQGGRLRIEAPEPREYDVDVDRDRLRLYGPDGELALQAYRYTDELADERLIGSWERADQPGVVLTIGEDGLAEIREPDGSLQDHGRASNRGSILFLEMAGAGAGAAVMALADDTLRLRTVVGPDTTLLTLVRRAAQESDGGGAPE